LAISSKKSVCASKKKLSPGGEGIHVEPAGEAQLDVAETVGERVRQLLRGRRAGLPDVVAADRQRLVSRDLAGAVLHQVADEAQMRLGGEQPLLLRDVLLEDVGLQGPVESAEVGALPLGGDQVHAEDRHGRAGDGHAGRDVLQRDALEQHVHVGSRVDGDAAVADLAERLRLVGVAAHQGGHVERHAEAATAGGQDHLVALVGLPGVAEPRELADGPGPAAISGRVQTSGVRELARPPDAVEAGIGDAAGWPVDRFHRGSGERGEVGVPLTGRVVASLPAFPSGLDIGCLHTHHGRSELNDH
jgi:hypothetical protein